VLVNFCEGIPKSSDLEQAYEQFNQRLVALKKETCRIGWGYGDAVQEILENLAAHFEER